MNRLTGLYAITPDIVDTALLREKVDAAVRGGARAIQYRNKLADADLAREQARALLAVTRPRGVPLIVNDSLELALAVDADGVHLGGTDGDIAAARRALGAGRLLGASCYNRIELARAARAAGVDYVAFGSVFPSPTKPQAVRAPLELLSQARTESDGDICAIGGITLENAAAVITAGATSIAVISAVFDEPDVHAAAAAFAARLGTG